MFCALLSVERFFLLFRAIFSATPSTFLSVEHFFLLFRALFSAIPSTFFCHSERERGIQYGCFTSLTLRSA
jgi:hypothetical protein